VLSTSAVATSSTSPPAFPALSPPGDRSASFARREVDAPNNLAMVALGAGLLWLGWKRLQRRRPYNAGADASSAVLNTNLATAVAFLVWVICDYATKRKPSMLGSVNGMIVGLVAITPAAGFVNGYGAIAIGAIGSVVVYVAYNYLALVRPASRACRDHAERVYDARLAERPHQRQVVVGDVHDDRADRADRDRAITVHEAGRRCDRDETDDHAVDAAEHRRLPLGRVVANHQTRKATAVARFVFSTAEERPRRRCRGRRR